MALTDYPCPTCHQGHCVCDRTAARARLLDGATLQSFPCPYCPMTVYQCVTDLHSHVERFHSVALQLGSSNGVSKEVNHGPTPNDQPQ